MKQYLDLCQYVLANGQPKSDRTGVGTLSFLAIKCDLIYQKDSHYLLPRKSCACHHSRAVMVYQGKRTSVHWS